MRYTTQEEHAWNVAKAAECEAIATKVVCPECFGPKAPEAQLCPSCQKLLDQERMEMELDWPTQ